MITKEVRPLILAVPGWEGTYVVNEDYRPIAEALVKKYDEIKHVPVDNILFIENTTSKAKNKDKSKYAQIGKIPSRWSEALYQLTGNTLIYFMEIFKQYTQYMTPAQITALVYHELRHINQFGDICAHDIEDWSIMVDRLGVGWTHNNELPDLLAEGINWDNICGLGQQSLFRSIMPDKKDPEPETAERDLQVVK